MLYNFQAWLRNYEKNNIVEIIDDDIVVITENKANDDIRKVKFDSLVFQAISLYKENAYEGTICMSHTVGSFTETCSVAVNDDTNAEVMRDEQRNIAFSKIFEKLVHRLEQRAFSWTYVNETIDPVLSTSAQFGLRTPIINIGWGMSISLSITTSSLLKHKNKFSTTENN